jgi:hypothetical protein
MVASMSIQERDYVLRMIQQLADALGRILGLKKAGKHEEALALVRATADGILGPLRPTLEQVDSASAATLIGGQKRLEAYAALVAEEASIRAAMGDDRRARAGSRRALELYLEAAMIGSEVGKATREAIRALAPAVDARRLSERHAKALATFTG